MSSIRGIQDVAERHLCTGCGTCAYLQPAAIRMVDDLDHGRRPLVRTGANTSEALSACPGVGLAHGEDPDGCIPELREGWGPVLALHEGHAVDGEIRWLASSGGAATALALHAIEREGMHGVLHIAARAEVPYLNATVFSRTREELLGATGSRYAPASPCDGLERIERAPGPCVFIGKPCDVAGAVRAAELRPQLREKLGLTIAIFCAGAPSTRATLDLAGALGFRDRGEVGRVRYRGKGWPGSFEIEGRGEQAGRVERQSYDESWAFLQRYRQWRCYVCADHSGEFADVSVGDPWYRDIPESEPGRSLVVSRTARGRELVERAVRAGALALEPVPPEILPASQPNLLVTRGSVWGRSLACRLLGVPAPRYRGLATFSIWWKHLSLRQRAQSIFGTLRRVISKRLRSRAVVDPWEPPADDLAH